MSVNISAASLDFDTPGEDMDGCIIAGAGRHTREFGDWGYAAGMMGAVRLAWALVCRRGIGRGVPRPMAGRNACRTEAFLALMLAVPVAICCGQTAPWTTERVQDFTEEDGVRALINAPAKLDAANPALLVIYTLPNGNTIEQTLGCRLAAGLDWHYDIQHVAAQ